MSLCKRNKKNEKHCSKMVENDEALLCKRGLTLSCHYVFIDNTSSLLVM